MDSRIRYQDLMKKMLSDHAHGYAECRQGTIQTVFDGDHQHYLLCDIEWWGGEYIHHTPILRPVSVLNRNDVQRDRDNLLEKRPGRQRFKVFNVCSDPAHFLVKVRLSLRGAQRRSNPVVPGAVSQHDEIASLRLQ